MLDIEFLKKFQIFEGLSDAQIKKIRTMMTQVDYPGGSVIIRDGDLGEEMYVLLDGEVEITKQMVMKFGGEVASSREKSLIRLSSKFHACFGEMSLCEERSERSATVSTATACKLAVLKRVDFSKLADEDPAMGFIVFRNLARIISDRLKRANKDLLKLTTAFVLAVEK